SGAGARPVEHGGEDQRTGQRHRTADLCVVLVHVVVAQEIRVADDDDPARGLRLGQLLRFGRHRRRLVLVLRLVLALLGRLRSLLLRGRAIGLGLGLAVGLRLVLCRLLVLRRLGLLPGLVLLGLLLLLFGLLLRLLLLDLGGALWPPPAPEERRGGAVPGDPQPRPLARPPVPRPV